MIQINDKKDCCGCSACTNICPKKCITMHPDNEGFLYPKICKDICVDCGLCEIVCPVINQNNARKPLYVYAAKNKNDGIRMQSSSGGVFTLLAEEIINAGGVVFGAKYDKNWNVVHSWTDTIEGIVDFRGSKYVQSIIGNTYSEVKTFLQENRKVLFSGTPCQIAGLKKFLRKEYENLLTVDIICHGVPSPMIWAEYLKFVTPDRRNIIQITMREKSCSWRRSKMIIKNGEEYLYNGDSYENIYMKGFLSGLYLRPSCHSCKFKNGRSNSDITIGDCWGIEQISSEFDDDKGISLIMLHSSRIINSLTDLEMLKKEISFEEGIAKNHAYINPTIEKQYRKDFWILYHKRGFIAVSSFINRQQGFIMRIKRKVRKILNLKFDTL